MTGSFVFLYHVSLAQPEGFHFSCSFSRELGDISSVTPPIPRVVLIPQLDISKRIIAVLVPNPEDADGNPPKEAYSLQEVMYNPKVVAHSVQDAALGDGEGCLSVDRNVPGYVVRHARVTVEYFTKDGEKKRIKLKGYNSIVVQHEIDHTNGIMFYDRINPNNPFEIKEGLLILE